MIQAVDRALRILTVLQGGRRMSLAEIARKLNLAPSTVHGIIRTLLTYGMVQRERGSAYYRLGPATLRLGNVYLDTLELRARALAWTPELARTTGHAVRAGVLLQSDVVVVAHEPRPDGTRQMAETGIVIPAHACALGKALLAFDTEAAIGDGKPMPGLTGETVTDRAELLVQLAGVRADRMATEVEEAVLGECGVAVPLSDPDGHVVGALGLVVPRGRWPVEPAAVDALRATARAVERQLDTRP